MVSSTSVESVFTTDTSLQEHMIRYIHFYGNFNFAFYRLLLPSVEDPPIDCFTTSFSINHATGSHPTQSNVIIWSLDIKTLLLEINTCHSPYSVLLYKLLCFPISALRLKNFTATSKV